VALLPEPSAARLSPPNLSHHVDLKEIRKIVELMNEHGLTVFDMSKEGFHLKLRKGPDLEAMRGMMGSMQAAPAYAPAPVAGAAAPASPAAAAPAAVEGEAITSPMVGTFYRKSSPDAPPFVNVGDAVSEGQTLCIIEAMKVMNEIKAEKSGIISAAIAEDGNPVQFGDILFRIK
jgi:acetyl-CoA carboxylase biotin carboxyl carrier protein